MTPFIRASALALALALGTLGACQEGVRDETDIFEEAEARYRIGDYDGATALYTEFLALYPRSPFSSAANLRLRTIEREVSAVMGNRGGNRPVYVRPELPDPNLPPTPEAPTDPQPPQESPPATPDED